MMDDATLAKALIGVNGLPAGYGALMASSEEARDYHRLKPYPRHAFRNWMTESRGPLPTCLPLAKSIVERGARWLFGKPIQINIPGNQNFEKFLRDAWADNEMDARMVSAAEDAGVESGVVLKFAYDEEAEPALSFQILSPVTEARLFTHPHNCRKLLMARIQYTYFDALEQKTMWYREEWTAEEFILYEPLPAASTGSLSFLNPDTAETWVIESREANPFGVIPCMPIKNIETDDSFGVGTLWDLFRVIDRINLTYHLSDKSNQFDVERNPHYIDLQIDEQDINRPLEPGQPLDLHTSPEAMEQGKQGTVAYPPGENKLREPMRQYAQDLIKMVFNSAGSVEVDQAEFTNKGNLTVAVLEQLFQPQIEMTNEQRKAYGQGGLIPFFALIGKGLAKAGAKVKVNGKRRVSYQAEIVWPDYFDLPEAEKDLKVARKVEELTAGFTTQERATQDIAHMNGVTDTTALLEELADEHARQQTEKQAQTDTVVAQAKAAENPPKVGAK